MPSGERTTSTTPTRTKSAAVIASTAGYRSEICAAQSRHRPRRNSQLRIGTLSCQRIGCAHAGQCEPGKTRLLPAGSFLNVVVYRLPAHAPSANSHATRIDSATAGVNSAMGIVGTCSDWLSFCGHLTPGYLPPGNYTSNPRPAKRAASVPLTWPSVAGILRGVARTNSRLGDCPLPECDRRQGICDERYPACVQDGQNGLFGRIACRRIGRAGVLGGQDAPRTSGSIGVPPRGELWLRSPCRPTSKTSYSCSTRRRLSICWSAVTQ